MNTTNDNSRLDLAGLAMEIAFAVSRLHPDYKHKGFDKRLHQKIIASLNEQGTPEPNSGIPLVLPRILKLVRDGNIRVHHNENDAPPSDIAEVEAEPWDWYVTPADADVIRRAMGLGPLVDKWVERRNKETIETAARHNAGIFTLDEVANELAQRSPLTIPRWRELLVIAVSDGKIPLRNPMNFADPSDYPVPEQLHEFAAEARKHPRDRHRGYSAGDTSHHVTHLEFTMVTAIHTWLDANPKYAEYRMTTTGAGPFADASSSAPKRSVSEKKWIPEARRIAEELVKDPAIRRLNPLQIAERVRTALANSDVRGRGGKLLKAATIARWALKAIKN